MATVYHGYDSRIYIRSLDRRGPVFRAVARLRELTVSHDTIDVSSYGGPVEYLPGPTRLDLHLTADGRDTRPTGDHPDVPLTERLALAVLDGDDSAVYPLIDAFFESRNR